MALNVNVYLALNVLNVTANILSDVTSNEHSMSVLDYYLLTKLYKTYRNINNMVIADE